MKVDLRGVMIGSGLILVAVVGSLFFIRGPSGNPLLSMKVDIPPSVQNDEPLKVESVHFDDGKAARR